MPRLNPRYDRQTTLNQAIAKIDAAIILEVRRLRFYKDTNYRSAYHQAWEMLSFYNGRRRHLIHRLIQVQIEEFNHE